MKRKFQISKMWPERANTLMGQHFLRSPKIIKDLIRAAEIKKIDTVLEIGPGKGTLTEALAKTTKQVIAVEKDQRLISFLTDKFRGSENVKIISGDILKLDLGAVIPKKYKIVANLPYYITSRFLRAVLEARKKPVSMALMVQLEVARRISAKAPNMNMLALSVQAYARARIVEKVPRSFFNPKPNVDSAIITITDINDSFFRKNKIEEKAFFTLARRAFQQKRKTLKNSIGIDSKKRPQELSPEDWATVYYTRHRISSNLL